MSKITTYVDGKVTGEETDEAYIYKWLAKVYIMKHRGSKDVRRIRYHQKYDGDLHATYYLSNGTIVEVGLDRERGLI